MTCYLYAGRKSLVFRMSMKICLHFAWVVLTDLISVWEIELDLIPMQDEMELVVVWVIENDFTSVWRIGIDLILCSGRKLLVFRVRIEISWVIVSGHRNRHDIRVGIQIDIISVMGSNLTCFSWSGSKLIWF